jgi:hypothetical protein
VSSRRVAVVAGVLLLVVLGTFRSRSEAIPDGTRNELEIGLWFSPWLQWSESETHRSDSSGAASSTEWRVQVEVLNWSGLVLLAALVLLWLGLRRRRAPAEVFA